MDVPSEEHILDLNAAGHVNDPVKAGAYGSKNWLAYSFDHL